MCRTPCVSTPLRWQLARCWRCLPAPLVPRVGLTPWRPTIARVLRGELAPVLPPPVNRKEAEQAERVAAAARRYRVLTPARAARPDEIGAAARAALRQLGDPAYATYSVAEDTERGELLRSIAVRAPRAGYAVWENGLWSSALAAYPTPHLCGSLDEWLLHVRGLEWTPPSCPRCGRTVKIKNDGQTYAHTRAGWHPPLRQECT